MSPSPGRYRRAGRTTGTCGLPGGGRQRQPVRGDRAAAAGSGGEQFGGVVGIEQPAVEQAREPPQEFAETPARGLPEMVGDETDPYGGPRRRVPLRMAVPGGQRARAGLGAAPGPTPAVSAGNQPSPPPVGPRGEDG